MLLSPTLAINQEIDRRRRAGLPVVALGFGEANIPVHPMLTAALGEHAGRAGYGPVQGLPELLDEAAEYWVRRKVPTRAEHVVVGPGSKALLFAVFEALGGPVLLPGPSWVSYAAQNRILGQQVVTVPAPTGQGGLPDPEALRDAATRLHADGAPAAAVLMTIPDNPTGTVASPDQVRAVCSVAEDFDLTIISDEIYLDLVHDPKRDVLTPAQIMPDRTIITTGLSKSLALGGWRLGVSRIPDHGPLRAVRERVVGVASEIWSAAAQPVQRVAALAFSEPPELVDRIAQSRRLHSRLARTVAEIFAAAGANVAQPEGGFYVYPDFEPIRGQLAAQGAMTSRDLAHLLLEEEGIATLPGVAFGDDLARLALRVAVPMLYGTDDDQRMEALEAESPETLPWITQSLDVLHAGLSRLAGSSTMPNTTPVT